MLVLSRLQQATGSNQHDFTNERARSFKLEARERHIMLKS